MGNLSKTSVSGSAVGSDGTVASMLTWALQEHQTHQLRTLPAISGPHETDVDRPFQWTEYKQASFREQVTAARLSHLARGIATNRSRPLVHLPLPLPAVRVRFAFLCTISSPISLPFRGSFHLSFALLVRYRSLANI